MKSNFEIYTKSNSDFDYWSVMLYIPAIDINKVYKNDFGDGYNHTTFRFDTTISFHKDLDGTFWTFIIKILGFGVSLNRQKGY